MKNAWNREIFPLLTGNDDLCTLPAMYDAMYVYRGFHMCQGSQTMACVWFETEMSYSHSLMKIFFACFMKNHEYILECKSFLFVTWSLRIHSLKLIYFSWNIFWIECFSLKLIHFFLKKIFAIAKFLLQNWIFLSKVNFPKKYFLKLLIIREILPKKDNNF